MHSLYRRYRPQQFSDIIGQDTIKQTLINAIEHNRLGHAYILSGPRGTGKTSIARIMAKTLNCPHKIDAVTPCLTCDICRKITNNQAPDVIELDAASHTSVDYIRELNSQVAFYPIECTYKLYIIDEAHMLSNGAFNALLKTIEEPPDNILFILATTEAHRIPKTVQSRCQQLVFDRISRDNITHQLQIICDSESITASPDSLALIAKQADGCMRDGITLLDQLISHQAADLDSQAVQKYLGLTSTDSLIRLLQCIVTEPSEIIPELDALFQRGINPQAFSIDWLALLKTALSLKYNQKTDLSHDQVTQLQAIIKPLSINQITVYMRDFSRLLYELRHVIHPEMAIYVKFLSQAQHASAPPAVEAAEPVKRTEAVKTPAVTDKVAVNTAKPAGNTATKQPEKPDTDKSQWPAYLKAIKAAKPRLYFILRGAQFHGVQNNALAISFQNQYKFFVEQLTDDPHRQIIKQCAQSVFGSAYDVQIITATKPEQTAKHKQAVSINDIVKLFQGKIISD